MCQVYTKGMSIQKVQKKRGRAHKENSTSCTSCNMFQGHAHRCTPNLPTNIVHFGGFDSSTILILRGGIPRPIGIS